MSRISKLTGDQAAALRETVAGRLTMGRSTEPLDREKAESAIREIYGAAHHPAPRFLHVSSPATCVLACIALGHKHSESLELRRSDWLWELSEEAGEHLAVEVFAHARQQVAPRLLRQVHQQITSVIETQLWNQLGVLVADQLLRPITDYNPDFLWPQVIEQIRAQLGLRIRPPARTEIPSGALRYVRSFALAGRWRSGLDVTASFLMRLGVKFPPELAYKINVWLREGTACHWWLPFQKIAIVCDRPRVLAVDGPGRLHSLAGPALAYGDGTALYAIHGVPVPEVIITRPDLITVHEIRAELDVEVRRVMIERYGIGRYLSDAGAVVIHEDRTGKLWYLDSPVNEQLVVVEVVNSTAEPDGTFKTYFLRVPPETRDASGAVAWTFGLAPQEYRPLVET
jgi:hypothetical protein